MGKKILPLKIVGGLFLLGVGFFSGHIFASSISPDSDDFGLEFEFTLEDRCIEAFSRYRAEAKALAGVKKNCRDAVHESGVKAIETMTAFFYDMREENLRSLLMFNSAQTKCLGMVSSLVKKNMIVDRSKQWALMAKGNQFCSLYVDDEGENQIIQWNELGGIKQVSAEMSQVILSSSALLAGKMFF